MVGRVHHISASSKASSLAHGLSIGCTNGRRKSDHNSKPLNASVYGSLKAVWRTEISAHKKKNPGKSSGRYCYHSLFNHSYEKSFTVRIMVAGFRKSVTSLFNGNAITLETTAPSVVSDRNKSEKIKKTNPSCAFQPVIHPTWTGKHSLAQSTPFSPQWIQKLAHLHPQHCGVRHHSEAGQDSMTRRRSWKPKQSLHKTTENTDDNSTCFVCRRYCASVLKKSTGEKLI